MKKIIITFVVILPLLVFNKTIISQLIIFAASKLTDRNMSIETIDIDYLKKQIILKSVEVESTNKIYYKNIFEAEKVKIKYDFKSLFTDLIIIDHLSFYNSNIFLDIGITNNEITNDNLGEAKKNKDNYKPKIYPTKKKDVNFLILRSYITDGRAYIKISSISKPFEISFSDFKFIDVGNHKNHQHYKEVLKIIFFDMYASIKDYNLKKLLKKIYNL